MTLRKLAIVDDDQLNRVLKFQGSNTHNIHETAIPSTSTQTKVLHELDAKILNILQSDNTIEEKVKQYQSLLQTYLSHKNKFDTPLVFPTPKKTEDIQSNFDKEGDTDEPIDFKEQLITSLPKSYVTKAANLWSIFSKSDSLSWNKKGEIIVDNKVIEHSNIVDLISDLVKNQKTSNPRGWELIANEIRRKQVPLKFIGNKKRLAFIEKANYKNKDSTSKLKSSSKTSSGVRNASNVKVSKPVKRLNSLTPLRSWRAA